MTEKTAEETILLTTRLSRIDPSPTITFKTRFDPEEDTTVIDGFHSIDWKPVWEAETMIESLNFWTALDEALNEAGFDIDATDDDYDERIDKLRQQFDEFLGASSLGELWKARQAEVDKEAKEYAERMVGEYAKWFENPLSDLDYWYGEALDAMGTDLKIAAEEFVETLDKQD